MEFRRINGLPPYVFATINDLKASSRRAGRDVIDLGFGNPDLPSPDVAVSKLAEAAHNPRNHRYSASRGIPKLRSADRRPLPAQVRRRARPRDRGGDDHRGQGGLLAPHVGAGRPGRHRAGALAVVPDPHLGPAVRRGRRAPGPAAGPRRSASDDAPDPGEAFFDGLMHAWEESWPKPRVIVLSFPHNPTTACVDLSLHGAARRLRPRARGGAGARLRLRRPRLRRLRAAVHPAGARRQGRGGRDLHDDQVVLHGRLARRLRGGQRARSSRR